MLRGGTYHESVTVPDGKQLTIQPYPHEAVWFDGASTVTGWQQTGSTWTVSNWNYTFNHKVSFSPTVDQSSDWVDPNYPMAGYPDAVWINGQEMTQVGSAADVTSGKFYVDESNHKLIIGSDPSGKTVEASTLGQAIKVWGSGSVIRGFGVKRYADTVSAFGAVSLQKPNVTLENMVITNNSTIGIYCWADSQTMRNLTVSDNGLLGIGCNQAPNLVITKTLVSGNNTQHFNRNPVSGGIKLTDSDNSSVTDNLSENNLGNGLWYDVSMTNATMAGNTIRDNTGNGILFEISDGAVITDNYVVGNTLTGIMAYSALDIQIWNNTVVNNARAAMYFWQDTRRQMKNVQVHNNVMSFGTGLCPVATQDLRKQWYGSDFDVHLDNNVYWRSGPSSPTRFACWADGSAGQKAYNDMAGYASGTGMDQHSMFFQGSPILTAQLGLTPSAQSSTASVGTARPSSVNTAYAARNDGGNPVGARGALIN